MTVFLFLAFHWYTSAFCQTFFLHRYGAHGMFVMSRGWERFFYVLTFLTQGSSYLNPRAYALMHRMHHAHSDTRLDPHSPVFHKSLFGMMRRTLDVYLQIAANKKYHADSAQGFHYPEWPSFDRVADSILARLLWATGYVTFYVFYAEAWWQYLFLPLHFFMGPVHGAIVNWCGHKYGYQNYDNKDHSKNTLFWDIFCMGELMQNNHHRFGLRPNFASRWYELDPTYPFLWLFQKLGVIRFLAPGYR